MLIQYKPFKKEAYMKRTILVALMIVMLATPCFAQEVEPDGMFSIEGTSWIIASLSSQVGYCVPFCRLGFYARDIYMENESEPFDIGVYFDLPLVSPFAGIFFLENLTVITLGAMQPSVEYGVGMTIMIAEGAIPIPRINLWHKVSDSWTHE